MVEVLLRVKLGDYYVEVFWLGLMGNIVWLGLGVLDDGG